MATCKVHVSRRHFLSLIHHQLLQLLGNMLCRRSTVWIKLWGRYEWARVSGGAIPNSILILLNYVPQIIYWSVYLFIFLVSRRFLSLITLFAYSMIDLFLLMFTLLLLPLDLKSCDSRQIRFATVCIDLELSIKRNFEYFFEVHPVSLRGSLKRCLQY